MKNTPKNTHFLPFPSLSSPFLFLARDACSRKLAGVESAKSLVSLHRFRINTCWAIKFHDINSEFVLHSPPSFPTFSFFTLNSKESSINRSQPALYSIPFHNLTTLTFAASWKFVSTSTHIFPLVSSRPLCNCDSIAIANFHNRNRPTVPQELSSQ